jgi:DNA polymerase-3 subunit delta
MTEIHYKSLQKYLTELQKNQVVPFYLIHGEELLYKIAFDALLDKLVPKSKRSFNFEPMDGTTLNIYDAIERLKTYSLSAGLKVTAIFDARLFYSKQDESRLLTKAKSAYDQNDLKKAAKHFISLLGLLNLSFEDVSKTDQNKRLKIPMDSSGDDKWQLKLIRYCLDRGLSITSAEGSDKVLQHAIEKGLPKGNILIITADRVDKRRSLFTTIKQMGVIIDCSVPKGDRKADRKIQDSVLRDRMRSILNQRKKKMAQDAYLALYEMTGFDLRAFSGNLEKLADFVGTRATISVEDVHAVLKRTKKDPIYEFTNAVTDRNTERALFFMDSILAGAEIEHPLQLLAALINQIRKLLLIKDFVTSVYGKGWYAGCPYGQFQNSFLPAIIEFDRNRYDQLSEWQSMLSVPAGDGAKKSKKQTIPKKSKPVTDLVIVKNPKSPYPVYQMLLKSENFSQNDLLAAIEQLSRADMRMKSSGGNPRLILEDVILNICESKKNAESQ